MSVVKVYSTIEQLSLAAADLFANKIEQAVQSRGRCNIVLAGGETPRSIYEVLAENPYCTALPWQQIHVYWGDERCVPPTDRLSNQYMARQSLLNHVPIPEENVHPIVYEGSPKKAAENYEKLLRAVFVKQEPQFDLVLLGLGDDGHTASLFPNTDVLNVQRDWVSDVYIEEKNMYRVTLTFPILNQAKDIAFLVTGARKAHIIQKVVEGIQDAKILPAQFIKPVSGELYWLLDEKAAVLLQSKPESVSSIVVK